MKRNTEPTVSNVSGIRCLAGAMAVTLAWSAAAVAGGPVVKLPSSYLPTFSQTGGWEAKVPMKHGLVKVVNGNEISAHVLASTHGNLDIPGKISLECPKGSSVSYLSYKVEGQPQKTLISNKTNLQSCSKALTLQPFSKGDLEAACQKAMGGEWLPQSGDPNKAKVVTALLKKPVRVWGYCSGDGKNQMKVYPVSLKLRCEDRDLLRPEPVRPARRILR